MVNTSEIKIGDPIFIVEPYSQPMQLIKAKYMGTYDNGRIIYLYHNDTLVSTAPAEFAFNGNDELTANYKLLNEVSKRITNLGKYMEDINKRIIEILTPKKD